MIETIMWIGKTILNVSSIVVFIVSLCAMDSDSWIPAIALLASAAWITFVILRDLDEDEKGGDLNELD